MISDILVPPTIGNYVINEQLGYGAFSCVHKAVNVRTGKNFAIKIIPKDYVSSDPSSLKNFQREINTTACMDHPNVLKLKDFLSDDMNYYLVMSLCIGQDLKKYIEKNGKLSENSAAIVFKQIAHATAFCHSYGVAHRDLKPENIMVTEFPSVKIADFGLCGYLSENHLMKSFVGSPCYCAPECLLRKQYNGRLSDIWSLGVILYFMVTGTHPWTINTPSIMTRQIIKGNYKIPNYVSPACRSLIMKMMRVNPLDRITLDHILKDPWVESAEVKGFEALDVEIPESMPISIEEISNESPLTHSHHLLEIVSPFKDQETDDPESPRILRLRSASLHDIRAIDIATPTVVKRKRVESSPRKIEIPRYINDEKRLNMFRGESHDIIKIKTA